MGRAPCCEDKEGHLKKGAWTAEEDEKLVSFIQTNNGHGSWRTLPKLAGLERCGKSCRLRWTNYLRPNIKRGNFTPEEERIIIQLHALVGNKWSSIASHLPGRTDNEVKNHWNTHLKKRLAKMGIDPTTHLPLRHVAAANYYGGLLSTQPPCSYINHTSNADDWRRALLQRCLQLDPSNMACHLVQWELARLEAEARVKLAAASSHEYMQNYATWLQCCADSMSSRGLLQVQLDQQLQLPLSNNNYNLNEYQLQLLQLAAAANNVTPPPANSTSSDSQKDAGAQLPQVQPSPYSDSHAQIFLKQQLNEVRSINEQNHSLDPAYNYSTCTSSPPANLFNYLSSTSSPFSEGNLPQLDIHDSIRKVPIYTSTHSGIATPDTSCSSETSTSHEVNIVSEYDQLQLMNPDDDHLRLIDTAALPQPTADPLVNLRRPHMSSPSDSLISDQTANSLNDSYWNKMLNLLGHATSFDNF